MISNKCIAERISKAAIGIGNIELSKSVSGYDDGDAPGWIFCILEKLDVLRSTSVALRSFRRAVTREVAHGRVPDAGVLSYLREVESGNLTSSVPGLVRDLSHDDQEDTFLESFSWLASSISHCTGSPDLGFRYAGRSCVESIRHSILIDDDHETEARMQLMDTLESIVVPIEFSAIGAHRK